LLHGNGRESENPFVQTSGLYDGMSDALMADRINVSSTAVFYCAEHVRVPIDVMFNALVSINKSILFNQLSLVQVFARRDL